MENQDNQNLGSRLQPEQQSTARPHQDIPTSAGGHTDHENEDQDKQKDADSETPTTSDLDEDAPSRLEDEEEQEKQPQINPEGEFREGTGWTRTEGLSAEERSAAEEEDLNGRHSGDGSII